MFHLLLPICCLLLFLSLAHHPLKGIFPYLLTASPSPFLSLPVFNTHLFLLAASVFHHRAVLRLSLLPVRHGLRSTGSRVFVSCYSMWARNSTIPPFQIACFLARKEHTHMRVCTHTFSLPLAKCAHTHPRTHAYYSLTWTHSHVQIQTTDMSLYKPRPAEDYPVQSILIGRL